jgi:hypothetical protein
MIENLFPSQIWKCSLNVDESIKNNILDQIEKKVIDNKNHLPPSWKCKVYTNFSNFSEKNNIDYSEIIPYFKNEYEKFSKQINLSAHNYTLYEIWYNYYLNGYNQEIHDHVSFDKEIEIIYSMVYFLKLNDDHPKITFYNYTNHHIFYSCNPKIKNLYRNNDINHSITNMYYDVDVEEGDLVIFPSNIPHGVFVQKNNESRITISSNIQLQ